MRSLNNPPTRSKTPPGTRGSSGRARVISALVKPGRTSDSRARAVHQLGAAALDRAPPLRGLAAGDWGPGRAGDLDFPAPSPEPSAPSRFILRAAGGTSV